MFLVPYDWLVDCFKDNITITDGFSHDESGVRWFVDRNKICKELGASKMIIDSIPLAYNDIKSFVQEAMKQSEVWKTMKLVVLGHGRIGKTTLLHQLRLHATSTSLYNV